MNMEEIIIALKTILKHNCKYLKNIIPMRYFIPMNTVKIKEYSFKH